MVANDVRFCNHHDLLVLNDEPMANNERRKPICWVYVPETFDPVAVLPEALMRHADSARYFLHRIVWGQVMKKRTKEDFVPLKFDYLREVIPDRVVVTLKEALLSAEVIECDGQYIEGRKSYGYRLGPKYTNSRIIRVAIQDAAVVKRVKANRRAKYKKVRLDVHRWLRSQFKNLHVDLPKAMSLLSGHRRFELVRIPVEQIANNESEFSVCRYGRVHTSLTRCPSKVRTELHVAGESLVSLDIANSQPLFLSLLIINYRKQGNKSFGYVTFQSHVTNPYRNIDKIIEETIPYFILLQESHTSSVISTAYTTRKASEEILEPHTEQDLQTTRHCPHELSVNRDFLAPDEAHFVRLCEQGKLYATFDEQMEILEMPLRHWLKQEAFEVIYGPNRKKTRLKSIFEELFPGVAEVIRVHKRKDYRFLPRLLQNIEANFVINTVCRRIMTEMPDTPMFTIHDSVLTTRQFVEPVRRIMFEEFARLGLTPTLHQKDYGESKGKALKGP